MNLITDIFQTTSELFIAAKYSILIGQARTEKKAIHFSVPSDFSVFFSQRPERIPHHLGTGSDIMDNHRTSWILYCPQGSLHEITVNDLSLLSRRENHDALPFPS